MKAATATKKAHKLTINKQKLAGIVIGIVAAGYLVLRLSSLLQLFRQY